MFDLLMVSHFNCVCFGFLLQGMNNAVEGELLEYSVHAGVQTTLQVLCLSLSASVLQLSVYSSYFISWKKSFVESFFTSR